MLFKEALAEGFSYLIDFHGSVVSKKGFYLFLQSRIYHFFLFPICRTTTSIERIPTTAPTETGDCVGSGFEGNAGATVPAGGVGEVFICDGMGGG